MDKVTASFDPSGLEDAFSVEVAGHCIELESHRMVFNPTSFGRNLALLLRDFILPGATVCEVGIGSGVLSILAGLLGAKSVTGLDVNPDAVHMARRNWQRNGLPAKGARFHQSSMFSALDADSARFDLVWSNPPVLPLVDVIDQTVNDRDGFEVAGVDGRSVLDGMLSQAKGKLSPDGRMLTIATSLQGWRETARLLDSFWTSHTILMELELELTDECGPLYVDWWLAQEVLDGEARIYRQGHAWFHKVWFIEARP